MTGLSDAILILIVSLCKEKGKQIEKKILSTVQFGKTFY